MSASQSIAALLSEAGERGQALITDRRKVPNLLAKRRRQQSTRQANDLLETKDNRSIADQLLRLAERGRSLDQVFGYTDQVRRERSTNNDRVNLLQRKTRNSVGEARGRFSRLATLLRNL